LTAAPWLVVGLGNPGPSYAGNRHNIGFRVVDALARRRGTSFKGFRGRADVASTSLAGTQVMLAKPRSFMNLSGPPVAAVGDFYKVPLERIVVIHDELDLPYGTLRLKRGGGDNGHNGLRSLTATLGAGYVRIRFGIGRPPGRMDPAAFVLRDFSSVERDDLDVSIERAADAVETVVTKGLTAGQNAFNS
jgi:PTH1 family peptidyl-tRNA hydrolase